MAHKGKPHVRASKEELAKRRAGVERQEDLAKRVAAGEDISKDSRSLGPTQVLKQPKEKPKQGFIGKALDIISAPLSQPKTTFTEGIGAGAEAVREKREEIRTAETTGEAARLALGVVGTTVATTAVAASAILATGAAFTAIRGLISSGGAISTSKVAATAAKLGVKPKVLQAAIQRKLLSNAVADLAGIAAKKTFIGLTKKRLTVVAGTLIGGSLLTQWLAADNAAGTASFQTNKIQGRFNDNELTRKEALSQIEGQITIIEEAVKFTKINTILNPALWLFRKLYVSTVENNLVTALENQRLITESEETTASMFERLRDEDDEKFAARDKLTVERDEEFKKGRTEADLKADARFAEGALFFEAIRKRNSGLELSPEELAVLIKYGADTKIIEEERFEPRSQLNFGGLF